MNTSLIHHCAADHSNRSRNEHRLPDGLDAAPLRLLSLASLKSVVVLVTFVALSSILTLPSQATALPDSDDASPSPYSALVRGDIQYLTTSATDPQVAQRDSRGRLLRPLHLAVRLRETGWLSIHLERARPKDWLATFTDGAGTTTIDTSNAVLFSGRVSFRERGERRSARVAVSAFEGVSGPTILILFERRRSTSGKRSFYEIEITSSDISLRRLPSTVVQSKSCGVSESAKLPSGLGTGDGATAQPRAVSPSNLKVFDLTVVADSNYFNLPGKGANSANIIASQINAMNVIYERDLGLSVNTKRIEVFSSSGLPFGSTRDAANLIDQLSAQRGRFEAADVYHLITGKDIFAREDDGTIIDEVVGLAFLRQFCSSRAVGVTEGRFNFTYVIMAHEIGHNLSADHLDPEEKPTTIMSPALPVDLLQFAPASQSVIRRFYNTKLSCLVDGGAPGAPTPAPPLPTPRTGGGGTAPGPSGGEPNPDLPTLSISASLSNRGKFTAAVSASSVLSDQCQLILDLTRDGNFLSVRNAAVTLGNGAATAVELSETVALRALPPPRQRNALVYLRARYNCGEDGFSYSRTVRVRADRISSRRSVSISSWIGRLKRALEAT